MNNFVTNLTLDLNCSKDIQTIDSAQFDKGRVFSVSITANGEPFSVAGCQATLKCVHSDKSGSFLDCTDGISVSGTEVTVTMSEDTLPVRGITAAKLVFTDGDRNYSTQIFLIDVDSSLEVDVRPTAAYSILNQLIDQIHALNENGLILVDNEITENGENPVSSGTIYDYVNGAIEDYADTVDQELDDKADLTNKVFKMEHLGVLFPSIQNGLPNVDTANNTLTLHKDTSLLLVSTSGSTQTRALAPNGDVVIDYSSIASSAVKIYYDLTNDRFNVLAYNGVPSQNDILICSIRDTSSFGTSNHGMSISCPYTVDGKLFGVNITEYIANNSITESKLATAFTQKLITNNSLIAKIEHLGVIMPSMQGGFPELDTVNNTLTLHKNTSLMLRSVTDGETQFVSLADNTDVVVDYSSIASSAVKIYFNLSTNTLRGVAYSTAPGSQDVLICTIRDVSQWGLTNHCMSISCPYIIDDKLFGVSLVDYIPNGSITESKLATAYKQSVQNSIDEISSYASGINSNVNSIKKLSLINLIKSASFAYGTVINSTGTETASTTRICSGFINVSDVRFLKCSSTSGYKYAIACYDDQKTFVAGTFGGYYWSLLSQWQTAERFIPLFPGIKYIRVVISDTSNSTAITLNDSTKIKVLSDYSQYRQFQNLENYNGLQESAIPHDVWANANIDSNVIIDSSNRIWSGLIECPKSGTIKINTATGYQAYCVVYDENMRRVLNAAFNTQHSIEIFGTYKYLSVFLKADTNGDISPSEGSDCAFLFVPDVDVVDLIPNNSVTEAMISAAYKQSIQGSIDEISSYASGINSNVNSIKKLSLINLIKSASFEYGRLNSGAEDEDATRIRSAFINISDVRYLHISVTTGFKYNIHFYKSDGTFIGNDAGTFYYAPQVNWNTEDKCIPVFPAVKYMRIVIAPTSNSDNITLADSNKVKVMADYSQYRQFQFLNNFCGKLQESIVTHNNWANAATNASGLDDSSIRICSGLIELPKSGIININTATGYEACYVVYNENMTRIKATEYFTSCTAEIGNNYKWIVVFVKVDSDSNVDISPSAGSNCTFSYIPDTQYIENVANSAVANAENVQHIDNIVTNPTVDISWEYGIIWQGFEGDGDPKFTRIRSGYIPVGKGTRVKCSAGYQHIVFVFDLQKKWISNPNWTTDDIVVDRDCLIRITVAKADNSTISKSEIRTIGDTETIIRELPQYIADHVLDFSDRIPSYYQPQLKTAIDNAITNIVAAGINGESFIFFSDPHEEANAGYSPALIKEVTSRLNIDKIICGGDMVEGGSKATIIKKFNDFVSAFRRAGKFFTVFGNHDTNTIGPNGPNDASEHLTKGETYALMQKQMDFDVQYGGLCYYFFDNPTTKTRFIVLDTGLERTELDNAQRTWFENALSNMPSDYHALIFAHIIYMSGTWYVGVSPDVFTRTDFMNDICAICDRFNSAENGKTVEAIFGGHTHLDLDPNLDPPDPNDPDHVNKFKSAGGIPIIIIDCDAMTTASADGQGNRDAVRGTITEQCFDIVTIDYTARIIYCVRIGRGSDRTISY